ncbi:MAG: dihydroorotase [Candidatus Binatus sp.]|uniref:dihydroorotase n=1 Tax=Candidatus Binatus sp. TaxID=2811406 RepID=UPI0027159EC9|nr:dihydroorotase [Candidatus Binatus sp.]MDO8431047.1 dihydroorotase [Candidatus Binatus sp.]
MKAILLKGGRVIDPASGIDEVCDVILRHGEIEAVEALLSNAPDDANVIDVAGCWVMPGLIDPHVHLRDPGFPEKETIASGLRAAAAGGFSAVAAMANTSPVNDTREITAYMLERAKGVRAARLVPVSAVTRGLRGVEPVDFAAMIEAGARMFSDDGIPIDDPVILSRALEEISRLGFATSLHEEDRALSRDAALNAGEVSKRLGVSGVPVSAEAERVRRDLALAIGSGAAVHIAHASTAETFDLIRAARHHGAHVSCEVAPHHFALDETAALTWGPNAKMNPPLRSRADVEAVHEAIRDGTADMIASDHAPHDPKSKQMDSLAGYFGPGREPPRLDHELANIFEHAANGIVGLETSVGLALDLVHRSLIQPARFVAMMSLNPATLLRLEAGTLAPGAAADVTVIDPNLDWVVEPGKFLSKSRNTPFAGRRLRGKAILTLVGGEIVYDGRKGAVR